MPECRRPRTRRSEPPIRHSREGGNPRTNIPRKNVNRDTTTYVHTATPLRLSGESTPRTPIRRRNPEGCGRCQFSYLGVPAQAGMSDWYENDVTWPRECPHITAPALVDTAPHFVIPAKAGIQRGGEGKCSAGACPPLGSGCGVAEPAVPIRCTKPHLRLSYLGVPAPAGMSDCYESMSRTPIRDRLLQQPLIGHSRHPFANPAPQSSFRRRPESRGVVGRRLPLPLGED